jgi:hypothetical protein
VADGSGEEVDNRLGLEVVLEQVLGGALHVGAPVLLGSRGIPRLGETDEFHVGADDAGEAFGGVVVVAPSDLGALAVALKIHTGTIGANVGGTFSITSPLGGVRQSSLGRRYGDHGFEEYLEIKAIGLPA